MPAVPTDPWSAGFMALGSVASAASQPAGPSSALSTNTNSFDNSGFVVNVGGTASSSKTGFPSPAQAAQAVAAGAGSLLSNPYVLIGVGVALYLYLKHK